MEILKSNLNFIRVNLPVAILNNLKKSYLAISAGIKTFLYDPTKNKAFDRGSKKQL